jgi:outer membrane immunogenic protein
MFVGFVTPAAQGARFEVHGGWDRLQSEGVKGDGLLYGVGAGYDVAVAPRVFLGAEVNADFSTAEKCERAVLAGNDKLCIRARRDLSAVGRLGFGVAAGSQVYLLAGYANARVSADYTPATGARITESATADGLRLGAGFQRALGSSAYTKVEYRYSNYEADTVRHQLIAGFGLRF